MWTARCITDVKSCSVLIKGDHARYKAVAVLSRNNRGRLALHERDERVRRTKIDADHTAGCGVFCHVCMDARRL